MNNLHSIKPLNMPFEFKAWAAYTKNDHFEWRAKENWLYVKVNDGYTIEYKRVVDKVLYNPYGYRIFEFEKWLEYYSDPIHKYEIPKNIKI